MKIIWHRISIQTLLFQACLPTRQNGVENRDKAYCTQQSRQINYLWFYRVLKDHLEYAPENR